MVLGLLSAEGFDPKRLTLEITEGVLMSNPDQARRSIEGLKKVGVKFALDDFGCGYASIGALRAFGFDRVKIDRSLVTALEEKANGRDVLTATVLLATALDIPVTAEGIEHPMQAEILREAGCDQFQGYLMGKPCRAARSTGYSSSGSLSDPRTAPAPQPSPDRHRDRFPGRTGAELFEGLSCHPHAQGRQQALAVPRASHSRSASRPASGGTVGERTGPFPLSRCSALHPASSPAWKDSAHCPVTISTFV